MGEGGGWGSTNYTLEQFGERMARQQKTEMLVKELAKAKELANVKELAKTKPSTTSRIVK